MKEFTVIWVDSWMSGSHRQYLTKKTWVCAKDAETAISIFDGAVIYVFEGYQLTIGEELDESKIETIN